MLVVLREDHKSHIQLLQPLPAEVLGEFCQIALNFMQKGASIPKNVQRTTLEPEQVQNCVYALVNLLLICCKHQVDDSEFKESVLALGFSEDQLLVLNKFYKSKSEEIKELLHQHLPELHYKDLRWRFEAQVASRCLLEQATPLISMELSLKNESPNNPLGSVCEKVMLQTDPNNLVHLADELERALYEAKSSHSRRIPRILRT
ncbi:unnamed protein product [Acanthoscelides obtectus]|uniref:COMM domain-containing protein n=1 Tax=Acanthoscelides obtectus TaxID=200917 RepID=A0A9P0KDC1_ACAOB|nr:unnamed protein product [Acanthoscelides obtectus]CAK1677216.1 COMM domain-containing protein 2 [Acanthoscelides obtectus]